MKDEQTPAPAALAAGERSNRESRVLEQTIEGNSESVTALQLDATWRNAGRNRSGCAPVSSLLSGYRRTTGSASEPR
jgi:hypothetical protein